MGKWDLWWIEEDLMDSIGLFIGSQKHYNYCTICLLSSNHENGLLIEGVVGLR